MQLTVKDLTVEIENKKVVIDANLEIRSNNIVVLAGPNGSGKSSLAYAIAGHPSYIVRRGKILFDGKNIVSMDADKRANLGIFLGFQSPPEISGVSLLSYLKEISGESGSFLDFKSKVERLLISLGLERNFAERYLNQGFSGGERKKSEILQLIIRNPKIAILDEPDSGLDVDGVRTISKILHLQRKKGTGLLVITHHEKIIDLLLPDKVYVMIDGKIVAEGTKPLIKKIQREGYTWLKKKA
ncbi:MAG: Fe-S cluster assembly ATPase SufC [Candidatus Anstonellales archaeon]